MTVRKKYVVKFTLHCKEFFDAEDPEQLKYLIRKKYAGNYLDFDFQIADKIRINEITEHTHTTEEIIAKEPEYDGQY